MDTNEEGASGLEGGTAETAKWTTEKHTPKAIVRTLDMWGWNKDQTHHKRIENVVEDDGLKTAPHLTVDINLQNKEIGWTIEMPS